MKIAETMCPVSTRAVSTHACLGHRGSARPPCQHVIGNQVLPGCSWGRQHRMGATVVGGVLAQIYENIIHRKGLLWLHIWPQEVLIRVRMEGLNSE